VLIKCFGEINEELWDGVSDAILTAGVTNDDLTVLISTYGGDLYVALAIYDLLRLHSHKVTTVAVGPCMSSGLVILQAGNHRAMTENAVLLTHYGEDGAASVEDVKQNNKMHEKHKAIVSQHVKVTKRTINGWYKHDTYFDAKKALQIGLVDEVLKCQTKK